MRMREIACISKPFGRGLRYGLGGEHVLEHRVYEFGE